MNINDYNKKLEKKFPNEKLKALTYTKMKEPCKIQCQLCKEIYSYKMGESPFKKEKQTFCKKCFLTPQEIKTKEKAKSWYNKIGYKEYLKYKVHSSDKIEVVCKHCNKKSAKSLSDLERGSKCLCQVKNRLISDKNFKKEMEDMYKGEYLPLEKYTGRFNKILVKHECGFIWSITPKNLIEGRGCPKCSKRVSKGEKEILKFLKENEINFIFQYPFYTEDGRRLVFDFYLPDRNLAIEFNGIQHYEPVKHFGGEEKFIIQQERDKDKILHCKGNNIELFIIKYSDNLEEKLFSMFNDYCVSK